MRGVVACDPLKVVLYQAACREHTLRSMRHYLAVNCGPLSTPAIAVAIEAGLIEVEGLAACLAKVAGDRRVKNPLKVCLRRLTSSKIILTEDGWAELCKGLHAPSIVSLPPCLERCAEINPELRRALH